MLARSASYVLASVFTLLAACVTTQEPLRPATCPVADADDLVLVTSRATADGKVVADWMGRNPGSGYNPSTPVALWLHQIWFTFADTGARVKYRLPTPLDPESLTFEIFSPDGAYVALLRGHGEPVDVIPTQHLRDYLRGTPGLHTTVTGGRETGDPAVLVEELRWTSSDLLEFTAACCGTYWTVKYRVGGEQELGPVESRH